MLSKLLNGHDSKRNVLVPEAPASVPNAPDPQMTDPQMTEKASRRRFSTAYKLSIIEQVDACTDRGEVGALLRREGLYYSTLANFRKQKAQGLLEVGSAKRLRGSKNPVVAAAIAQQMELERENRKLRRQLAQAEHIIAIQKKAAILLGETLQDMQIEDEED
jgi:transposase